MWDGSTREVLVMERMRGVSVGEAEIKQMSAVERNEVRIIQSLRALITNTQYRSQQGL